MNKISDDLLIRLLKHASLGRLIGGLIHNMNGPMQNLGLDIEMSNLILKDISSKNEDFINNLNKRLARMEEEFNRLDLLIRSASIKADPHSDYYTHTNFNDFIEQELDFFNANLYFKHNILKKMDLEPDPPKAVDLPKNFYIVLSWFLQAVIEELEAREAKELSIKSCTKDSKLEINLYIEKNSLSNEFLNQINYYSSDLERSEKLHNDITTAPFLNFLKKCGGAIRIDSESDITEIKIIIPLV